MPLRWFFQELFQCTEGNHRQIINGVEIDVIKINNEVVSGYPTGKVNAPYPSGF